VTNEALDVVGLITQSRLIHWLHEHSSELPQHVLSLILFILFCFFFFFFLSDFSEVHFQSLIKLAFVFNFDFLNRNGMKMHQQSEQKKC
jgi:hypothetical protein